MADDLFVFFDGTVACGHMNGIIQVELIANVLDAEPDGSVKITRKSAGHLRCSPAAAADLTQALNKALEMMKGPASQPAVSGTLN